MREPQPESSEVAGYKGGLAMREAGGSFSWILLGGGGGVQVTSGAWGWPGCHGPKIVLGITMTWNPLGWPSPYTEEGRPRSLRGPAHSAPREFTRASTLESQVSRPTRTCRAIVNLRADFLRRAVRVPIAARGSRLQGLARWAHLRPPSDQSRRSDPGRVGSVEHARARACIRCGPPMSRPLTTDGQLARPGVHGTGGHTARHPGSA